VSNENENTGAAAAEKKATNLVSFPQYSKEEFLALNMRLLTPREIANLLHFPAHFRFPPGLPTKTCYQLLGNSINVKVV